MDMAFDGRNSDSNSGDNSAESDCGADGKNRSFGPRLCSCCGLLNWLVDLQQEFGKRFIVLLFCIQHLIKGLTGGLSGRTNPYLFKHYHITAQDIQVLKTIIFSPYVLKPILGLTSDLFPICGYNKAPYMFLATLVGILAAIAVGIFEMPLQLFIGCLFLVELMICEDDLLTEAAYARKMQDSPALGQSLLTFVFSGMCVFSLIANLSSGFALKYLGPHVTYIIAGVSAVPALFAVGCGFLKESRKSKKDIAAARAKFWNQKEACALAFVLVIVSVSMSVCAILTRSPLINAIVCIAGALVVVVSFSLVLSPVIAKFAAFTLLQTSLHPSVSGPSFYFMTDGVEEFPEGPHFSKIMYNTVFGSVGAIFSLLGLYTYNRYSSRFSYRTLLVFSNVAFALLHLLDILLFTRANLKLGLPDFAFAFGNQTLGTAIYQWLWMPQVGLFSQLCPKGMEATMFALVVACHNLGVAVASSSGALMLHFLGCNPRGSPGDAQQFENLWLASAISSLLPLISISALFWLVPNIRPGDQVAPSLEVGDGTTGSVWKRFMASRSESRLSVQDSSSDGETQPT